MKKTATPTIEITYESPCDGRFESILRLVEGDEKGAARTQTHLKKCTRCRAFFDSLQAEDYFVRKSPSWRTRDLQKKSIVEKTTKEFERWLDRELSYRSGEELAEAICNLGRAVCRYTLVASRSNFIDVPVTDRLLWQQRAYNILRRQHVSVDARQRLGSLVADCTVSDSTGDLLKEIAKLATSLTSRDFSLAHYLLGLREWYFADSDEKAGPYFVACLKTAPPAIAALALSNLAVWHMDRGNVDLALKLSRMGRFLGSRSQFNTINYFLWRSLLGKPLDLELNELVILGQRGCMLPVRPGVLAGIAANAARILESNDVAKNRTVRLLADLTHIPAISDATQLELDD